ncbi:MAG: carboxypeptidase regulatory-like domain-containing protein, partial [Candidatus Cloacimonetes bacterium]|nr:carboxypeptidase regulatory-like domain-containing protein [Candidatus Cloacimonadota bacterium]
MKRLSLLLVMIFILGMVFTALNASEVTIGAGDQQARVPVDMYWKNSLFQCLYLQTELNIVNGSITGVAFYNNFTSTDTMAKPTKIWLGTTTQTSLTANGWIPSTQLTQVFDGVVDYPIGANTINITFTAPFNYTGGSLVMMVNRPMDTDYFDSTDNFAAQTIGTDRALKLYSDTTTFDPTAPPTTGATLSGQFPKTTFFYTGQGITNDLGILSLSGNTTPSAQSAWNYTIAVKNNGQATQTSYTVKLFKEGDVEIGSVAGTSITEAQTIEYTIPWTPTVVGPTFLYAKVILTDDQVPANNQSANYPVVVQPAGIVAVTVGAGGATGRMPVNMYYKNSLFESVYLATELNIGGLLTGIQFYNNFTSNLPSMPTKIWVGETTQTDLSAGWIPSTQLTSVYDGVVDYPSGANNINITFTTPFPYGGGNLVVMVQRPMDTDYYESTDTFVTQTLGTSRTLNLYSDTTAFDPAAPATATATGIFPKTTFFFITQGMGALNGTVTVGGTPLAGATVTVANSTLTYTTGANGTYSFPYIAQGAQTVSATKHGYNVVSNNVTIVEDQTTTSNFALALLPQVTVTGKIVGSDAPTVGLAGATIALSGYEPYTATTNATGNFTITGVFASQTYNYTANATGYAAATGTVVVGTTNVNMGNVTVAEMSYPPYGVVATEAANFSNVALTWQAPNPGAVGITEGFEGTTFPPTDWSQIITDTSAAGTTGVTPTWCRVGTIALTPAVPAHGGEFQTAMWWSYSHQDEWLMTPQFACPGSATLNFWSYVFYGSVNNDHYYVKLSTNGGTDWTVLWDATTLTGGQNAYTTPISIDLSAYAGQQIKLAWHADDPNTTSDGMWYVWFMDDISIAGPSGLLKFSADQLTSAKNANIKAPVSYPTLPASRALVANPKLVEPNLTVANSDNDRTMLGYKVWRLLAANQANETLWTSLTTTAITPTNYTDNAWQPLPSGVYKFAVKSVYTNNVMSTPAFSNEIHKGMMGTLTGTVLEFNTNIPVAGATVTAGEYSGVSNASGVYSFGVYAGTYTVTCAKASYQTATQAGVVITGTQATTQNFVMTEITLPAAAVQAAVAGNNVNVTWMAPGTGGGEWLSYDGDNDDSIGTGGVADFDVAIRFPATVMADYAGMSLYSLKVWPAQAGTFSARVWTGGTPTAPGTMVADQAFTPTLDVYNTVMLTNPVAITGAQELWFGYNVVHAAGTFPAGTDAGPALDGFGNMIYSSDAWSTLYALAPTLDYNWNIQGYVGYSAPTAAPELTTINGTLFAKTAHPAEYSGDRALTGYKVWRLLQGQETNETAWTSLTADPITATAHPDNGWGPLPDGTYKWSVKAVYTGGALSIPAFSNAIPKYTQIGTIAGIVRNTQNQAIAGATVTAGEITATTN